MGGNGSFLSGITNFENGRMYKTVSSIGDNIKVLETKNPKAGVKLPEESHTPNRTYATFYRNGKGLKEIARYGPDGKKIEEIHIVDHKGLGPHYHKWANGRPIEGETHTLTTEMKKLVNKIINFKK